MQDGLLLALGLHLFLQLCYLGEQRELGREVWSQSRENEGDRVGIPKVGLETLTQLAKKNWLFLQRT